MSVCIAAICYEDDQPRIVLCRDWKGEIAGVGSTETIAKEHAISKDWIALLADNISRSQELCVRYQYHLKTQPFTEQNLGTEVRKVFHEYKKALADSYLKSTYGISFDHLITNGRDSIGEKFTTQCLEDISRLTVNSQLILAGFIEGSRPLVGAEYREREAMICTVSEMNEGDPVTVDEEFSAIGSGHTIARAMLCLREQEIQCSLMQTIYAVYEAKLMTLKVPGVGEAMSIEVFYPDGTMKALSDNGFDRCFALFRRFGPKLWRSTDEKSQKRAMKWFDIDDSYLEDFSDDLESAVGRAKQIEEGQTK